MPPAPGKCRLGYACILDMNGDSWCRYHVPGGLASDSPQGKASKVYGLFGSSCPLGTLPGIAGGGVRQTGKLVYLL